MKIGIVGCGINGAYLAWKLSKRHEVTVFEKNKTIGEKPCSGLISERLWDFIPPNKKLIENLIDEAIINFPRKKIKLKFHPKMLVINRKLLDQYVSKFAKENGANILLNNPVKRVYFVKGRKPSILADKIYEFDYLIGCDGFNSIVRRSIDVSEPKYKLGIYTYKNKRDKSNVVNVFPSKNGFAWIIPRGSNVEYGLLEDVDIAKEKFNRFCRSRKIKPKKIYSHIIPVDLIKAEAGRIALCGDAIGLTKPLSGGGVIWGLISCDILLKSFPDFKKYNNNVKKFFEPKFIFSRIGNRIVRFLGYKLPYFLPKEIYFDSDLLY
jgi:flavin-dependent dehydrogenase